MQVGGASFFSIKSRVCFGCKSVQQRDEAVRVSISFGGQRVQLLPLGPGMHHLQLYFPKGASSGISKHREAKRTACLFFFFLRVAYSVEFSTRPLCT